MNRRRFGGGRIRALADRQHVDLPAQTATIERSRHLLTGERGPNVGASRVVTLLR